MNTTKQLSESKENDLEQIIWNAIQKLDKRIWIVLFSSVFWGIFAHGMTMFNKYSIHDDTSYLFGVGATIISGRWMLAMLDKLHQLLFAGSNYSLPLVNVLISILLIAASAYLIIHLLNIQKAGLCISISGILVSFPSITGIFGYMFTAPYYMISLFLAVSGVWIANKKQMPCYSLTGIFLMAASIGIYQAFIPVMLSLALLCYISKLTADSSENPKTLVISGVYLLGTVISGVLLYFLINKCFLTYYDLEMTSHLDINTMGKDSLAVYLSRVPAAIRHFLTARKVNGYTSMFPFRIRHLYILTILLIGLLSLWYIIRIFRKNIFRGILLTLSVLLFPVACNFIFIMCAPDTVHTLMLYGQSMVFVYLVWLLDNIMLPKITITRSVYGLGTTMMLFISFSYCRYANINYLKVEYSQQRLISYYTVLITQIKSTPGYLDELPVVFINSRGIQDQTLQELSGFETFFIRPYYRIHTVVNDYVWFEFMNNWCAFSPELADEEDFKDLPEVVEMPYYPDDGSIRIINDTVVVKFGPAEE